jgi:hypothetical protein
MLLQPSRLWPISIKTKVSLKCFHLSGANAWSQEQNRVDDNSGVAFAGPHA